MFNLVFGTPTVLEDAWVEVKAFFAGLWLAMTEPSLFLKALWEDLLKGYEAEESTFGKASYIAQHTTEVILAVITVVKAGKALLKNAGKAGPEIEKLKNVSARSRQSIDEAGKKGLETAKGQKRGIDKSAKEIEQKVVDGKSKTQKKITKGVDDLFKAGRTPKASELKKFAEQQGWKPKQTEKGPLKYFDDNGVNRMTIKQGSFRAPGSANPHVELRNTSGQRVDPAGNPVTRKSTGNHTPIDYDL